MLGAGEALAAPVAQACVVSRREALDVVIGSAEASAFIGQPSEFVHQLAFFFMEAKRISVARRKPRQPISQRVKV